MLTTRTIFRFATLSLMAAALAVGVASFSPAHAQSRPPTPVIGVLDMQALLVNSLAGKGLRLEQEKRVKPLEKEFQGLEQEANQEAQALEERRQKGLVAPDVIQQQLGELQGKYAQKAQALRAKQQALGEASRKAAQQIEQVVSAIVQEVAKNRGLNLILNRGGVVVVDPAMDITPEVLRLLDERLPSVDFVVGEQ